MSGAAGSPDQITQWARMCLATGWTPDAIRVADPLTPEMCGQIADRMTEIASEVKA